MKMSEIRCDVAMKKGTHLGKGPDIFFTCLEWGRIHMKRASMVNLTWLSTSNTSRTSRTTYDTSPHSTITPSTLYIAIHSWLLSADISPYFQRSAKLSAICVLGVIGPNPFLCLLFFLYFSEFCIWLILVL